MGHRALTSRQRMAVAVLLVGSAGWSGQAWAYDDGYQNVFSSVLTAVGVMPADKTPEIEYRERPPLVLPPKQELGKPEPAGVKRTAEWPQDPDVIARRKASEEAHAPMVSLFDKSAENARPDTKQEMLRHRAVQAEAEPNPGGCGSVDHSDAACRLSVQEMRRQDARYKSDNPTTIDTVTAGVEPDRVYLTQPPKGYLKATKTVHATAEAPEIKRDTSSPLSGILDRPKHDDDDSPNN